MFKTRLLLIGIILLILSVGVSASVSAQATEEADPRAAVLQAFEIMRHDSYHFTVTSSTTNTYNFKNGQSFTNAGIYSSSGEVASNGDYHDTIALNTGTTLSGALNNSAFKMERTVVKGETYLNLSSNLLDYLQLSDVQAGWWRYSDLVQQINDPQRQMSLDSLANSPIPSIIPITDATVNSVTEGKTNTVDNRSVRVYDLKLNDMDYLFAQRPGTTIRVLLDALKEHDLLSSFEPSLTTKFLLGTEDGRLYQITNQGQLIFHDLATSANSSPTIDELKIKTTSTYTLDYPDQPAIITPPDSSLLNH